MPHLASPYEPRRPQETVLFGLVKKYLGAFLEHARETYAGPLPKYVVDEFRGYLACGDFSRGFALVTCRSCGDEMAVSFSCKLRGLCPSCAGRRMAGLAAHLVDRVLPSTPVRQYVLAFPYELSGLAATRPDVLAALSRIFWESLRGRYQAWAKTAGLARSSAGHGETGAVTGVHRAGASLNVHVHFHILCLDGVYVPDADGTLSFEPAPTPTRAELTSMLERIYARVMKWLARRRLLRNPDDAGASNAPPELSPAEALATAAMQRGSLVTLRESTDGARDDDPSIASPPPRVTDAVTHERFNLHASVHLAANDDVGRERLCRYLNRPAFSLARLRLRRDGTVSYRVKKASRGRVTERVMTPIETMARLAAMVPPPRYPLLRFHGVLAPRHRWRDRVVPRPPPARAAAAPSMRPPMEEAKAARCRPAQDAADGRAAFIFDVVPAATTATLTMTGAAKQLAPNVLSLAHWDRILQGELYATSSRIDWRTLLKRTFDVDLRVCVRCGGKLTVRTVFTDPASVAKLLAVLRCPRAPPTAA